MPNKLNVSMCQIKKGSGRHCDGINHVADDELRVSTTTAQGLSYLRFRNAMVSGSPVGNPRFPGTSATPLRLAAPVQVQKPQTKTPVRDSDSMMPLQSNQQETVSSNLPHSGQDLLSSQHSMKGH